jgi:hypothetical protein
MFVTLYRANKVTLRTGVIELESSMVGRIFKKMKVSLKYDHSQENLICDSFIVTKVR